MWLEITEDTKYPADHIVLNYVNGVLRIISGETLERGAYLFVKKSGKHWHKGLPRATKGLRMVLGKTKDGYLTGDLPTLIDKRLIRWVDVPKKTPPFKKFGEQDL